MESFVFCFLLLSFSSYSLMQLSSFPLSREHSRYWAISTMQPRIALPVGVLAFSPSFPEKNPRFRPSRRPEDSDVASTVHASAISPVFVSITFRSTAI